METPNLKNLFEPLYAELTDDNQFYAKKPVLAHYTTLSTLELIIKSGEFWFSNPLYMNDLEELRFGILHGLRVIRESKEIREALETEERHRIFLNLFEGLFQKFDTQHVLDTYVLCTSEHSPENDDGILSMWRAYGGNGNGAALIMDTAQLEARAGAWPIILAKVEYGNQQKRLDWLAALAGKVSAIIKANKIPSDRLGEVAFYVFDRIKLFAIFTKHIGFLEEQEWRVVYMRDRDPEGKFDSMFSYFNGPRGAEPKLKFPVKPIPGLTQDDLSFNRLISKVLLGPTTSSPLAKSAVKRMLKEAEQPELAERVVASTIPLRPS